MRTADWTDSDGRIWRVALPDGIPEGQAALGAPIGPPDLTELGLPKAIMVRLHNQLHARGIWTYREARRRHAEVFAAWQAALRTDVGAVLALYKEAS